MTNPRARYCRAMPRGRRRVQRTGPTKAPSWPGASRPSTRSRAANVARSAPTPSRFCQQAPRSTAWMAGTSPAMTNPRARYCRAMPRGRRRVQRTGPTKAPSWPGASRPSTRSRAANVARSAPAPSHFCQQAPRSVAWMAGTGPAMTRLRARYCRAVPCDRRRVQDTGRTKAPSWPGASRPSTRGRATDVARSAPAPSRLCRRAPRSVAWMAGTSPAMTNPRVRYRRAVPCDRRRVQDTGRTKAPSWPGASRPSTRGRAANVARSAPTPSRFCQQAPRSTAWMAGTSPAMTTVGASRQTDTQPRSRPHDLVVKIPPLRIYPQDQRDLPRPRPMLDVLLALNCRPNVFVALEAHQALEPIARRKSADAPLRDARTRAAPDRSSRPHKESHSAGS